LPAFRAPRGTRDILPEEQHYWDYVTSVAESVCLSRGYGRIETPIFEDSRLFLRGVGEGTDIVEKEMYIFEDRGGNSLALRPEGTASVCRAYLEHGMASLTQPVRMFYLAPAFRYERPQAGRMREHHQFGYEVIGDASALVDAEVISMSWQFLFQLGLRRLTLKLNSIGCDKCRPGYIAALLAYYEPLKNKLCRDCGIRMEKNPLRLLDCKEDSCQQFANNAPMSTDCLCEACLNHFNSLKKFLDLAKIDYVVSHRLVRGLDYYTRTVFEIQPESEGSQSTIGGGGRYDRLVEQIGGKPTPAIGFAAGIERIILNLKEQNLDIPGRPFPKVFIAHTGEEARSEAFLASNILLCNGIGVIVAGEGKSLKAQLRQANNLGMKIAVIIGPEELEGETVIIRDLEAGTQETIGWLSLLDSLNAFKTV